MSLIFRRPAHGGRSLSGVAGGVASFLVMVLGLGCASPGPPHAPSLNLPKPAADVTVRRAGDRVEVRFTAPSRTTDNLPLPGAAMSGVLCRQLERQACVPVGVAHPVEPSRLNSHSVAVWVDVLPAELTEGRARLLGYRVELLNAAKQSAGRSDAAYTVAGAAPAVVEGLRVEGSRAGALLRWSPVGGAAQAILIGREDLSVAAKQTADKRDGVAELEVNAADAAAGRVVDATAKPERAYRYTAVRRTTVQLGGRAIEVSGAVAEAVPFTLHLVYPPPVPTGLTAAGFTTDAGYAVDLIWQPVDDAGLLAGLAGYNVYRDSARLNAAPVAVPAFHDAAAVAGARYSYRVTAVDGRGNESGAVVVER